MPHLKGPFLNLDWNVMNDIFENSLLFESKSTSVVGPQKIKHRGSCEHL